MDNSINNNIIELIVLSVVTLFTVVVIGVLIYILVVYSKNIREEQRKIEEAYIKRKAAQEKELLSMRNDPLMKSIIERYNQ